MTDREPVVHAMPFPGEPRATHCCGTPLDELPAGDRLTPMSHKETCGR